MSNEINKDSVFKIYECLDKFWDCEDHSCSHYKICENGILFTPEDSISLEQALIRVMEDTELRKKLSENARIKVLRNNSIDIVAGYYIDLLNN